MPFIDLNKVVKKAQEMRELFNDQEFEEFYLSICSMYEKQRKQGYETRYVFLKNTR